MKYIAWLFANLSKKLLKLLGKGAGNFPGKLALKLDKNLLIKIKYPKITVLVTGTNGKTTTANLISAALQKSGLSVSSNSKGDNLISGITTAIITNVNPWNFKLRTDALVLEVDELSLAKHFHRLSPSHVVITNFFRDQLDRAGEMENVISRIENALHGYSGKLVLCGDDPNTVRIGYRDCLIKKGAIFFSLLPSDDERLGIREVGEGKYCPHCNHTLSYKHRHYSHIGRFSCTKCAFGELPDQQTFYFTHNENTLSTRVPLSLSHSVLTRDYYQQESPIENYPHPGQGKYFLYNEMAAISTLRTLDVDISPRLIGEAFYSFSLGIGRMESISQSNGQNVVLNLVKNPVGTNEILKYIAASEKHNSVSSTDFLTSSEIISTPSITENTNNSLQDSRNYTNILFILSDAHEDGQDVSWIWDIDFSHISHGFNIICSGKRAYDLALRFKFEGINSSVVPDIYAATEILKQNGGYVLSVYSELLRVRKELLGGN